VKWGPCPMRMANSVLTENHYLGAHKGNRVLVHAGFEGGPQTIQVWKLPSNRHLPSDGSWLELCRWCILPGNPNLGSMHHAKVVRWMKARLPEVTTLISYSDPSAGHTGSLYRACNWEWAPTWHRLRPPPSGNGDWGTGQQSVKDRWVFRMKPDVRRPEILRIKDQAIMARLADMDLSFPLCPEIPR